MIVESPSCSIGQVVRGRGWPVTSWGATGHLLSPEWGWEATLSSRWEQWQPPWPGLPWVVTATAHVWGHFKKNKCLWVSQVCTSGAGGASWVQLGSTGWSSACGRTGRCLLVGPWGLQPCGLRWAGAWRTPFVFMDWPALVLWDSAGPLFGFVCLQHLICSFLFKLTSPRAGSVLLL